VPFDPDCTVSLPWAEGFDAASKLADVGFQVKDFGNPALANWVLAPDGELGPDKFLRFRWTPTANGVKTIIFGPRIDCHTADPMAPDGDSYNKLSTTTVQWRMRFRHATGGKPVTLRLVLSSDSGTTWTPVAEWPELSGDIEYGIFSYPLPGDLWKAPDLRVGFQVEAASTADVQDLQIDDVRVAAGVPNQLVKSFLLRCHSQTGDCSSSASYDLVCDSNPKPSDQVPRCEVKPGESMPELTMGVCERYRLVACYDDPDACYSSWNFFGFPASKLDGSPLESPPFITPEGCVSGSGGMCPTSTGGFICSIEVAPKCQENLAGSYRVGVVTVDEYDPKKKPHSIFETLSKLTITVLLEDGFIVWAPNGGATDPEAMALRNAIASTGRKVQILRDILVPKDLSKYSGILAVLGSRGRTRLVTEAEAQRLAAYLESGGSLYVEGGDFWSEARQPKTSVHPYFKVFTLADGPAGGKLEGPAVGYNFLDGLSYALSQGPVNNYNDLLGHAPASGALEVLRVSDPTPGALAVAYEGLAKSGKTYRTIASSFPWAGLLAGPSPTMAALDKYLTFMEKGHPGCQGQKGCEDLDPCTADACVAGSCKNQRDPQCIECMDDLFMADGVTPSCPPDQACVQALGTCKPIFCGPVPCTVTATYQGPALPFSPKKPAEAALSVSTGGTVRAVQVQVRVTTPYRGGVVLTLIAPDGKSVRLKDPNPSDWGSDIRATYDMGVPLPKDQSLATLVGRGLAGTWRLRAEAVAPPGALEVVSWTLRAAVRQEDGLSCQADDECASAWCDAGTCRTPQPLSTLLYEEDCWTDWPTPYKDALDALGWQYSVATGEKDFLKALKAGGFDLVIYVRYRTQSAPDVIAALKSFVDAGGRLVFSVWDPDFKQPLYGLMGIDGGVTYKSPAPLNAWEPDHPLFARPFGVPATLSPVQDTCIVDGARVTVKDGVAVAGLGGPGEAGQAAVVIGPTGRTIYMGEVPFLFAPEDARGFLANQIHWLATHGGM